MKKLLFVLLLMGCSGESDIEHIEYYSNGEYVGLLLDESEGVFTLRYNGISYKTDLNEILIRDASFIYSDPNCEQRYIAKGQASEYSLVHSDKYNMYRTEEFRYMSMNAVYRLGDTCELTTLKGGWLSKVYAIERFNFVDLNNKFYYTPIKE